jgi:hypothetical protein
MKTRKFRFKNDRFCINGVCNIPGFIICTGHGYDFQTYCCKNCGEIYVEDLEGSYFQKTDLSEICKNKTCQKCNSNLQTSLVRYPENIFHNGKILKNHNPIIKSPCDETDDLLEVYVLN